jgi:outer membrane protein assembly factor BamB
VGERLVTGDVTYGDALVVTADTGVYAHNRGNGTLLWTAKPPANGATPDVLCGSGQTAVNSRLPVGFGKLTDPEHHDLDCTSVGLVDLRSGKMSWTQQIPTAAQLKANPLNTHGMLTEISGDTVIVACNSTAAAFSVSTVPAGAQFPGDGRHVLDAMTVGGNSDSHPYIKAIVGGGMLIAVSYPTGAQSRDRLIAYSLSTGAKRWSASAPGIKMIAPVAVDGSTVLAVGSTDTGMGDPTLVRVSLTSGTVLSSKPRPTGPDAMQDYISKYHFTWSDGRAYAVDWDQEPSVSDVPGLFTLSPAG